MHNKKNYNGLVISYLLPTHHHFGLIRSVPFSRSACCVLRVLCCVVFGCNCFFFIFVCVAGRKKIVCAQYWHWPLANEHIKYNFFYTRAFHFIFLFCFVCFVFVAYHSVVCGVCVDARITLANEITLSSKMALYLYLYSEKSISFFEVTLFSKFI